MALLTLKEARDLTNTIISVGIDVGGARPILLTGINPFFTGQFTTGQPPNSQLYYDINRMSQVERLTTGEVPLEIFLGNASMLLAGQPQEKIIQALLDRISHAVTGAPVIDITKVPEIKQQIIHQDDMLPAGFMERGMIAGQSVMKLKIKSYQNGQPRTLANGTPMVFIGTGWLITENILLTNHHVVNARKEGETPASVSDFTLQGRNGTCEFDFDSEGTQGVMVDFQEVIASDSSLDYAVIRIGPTGRRPLQIEKTIVNVATNRISVNIIQHPRGESKRYAIRNNLVTAVSVNDMRYFTDTAFGSSGSPVLNDQWKVVALHRGSNYVSGVQFQGKDTAYVNVGTPIVTILDHLETHFINVSNAISG